jgi:glutaredoxin 2
MAVLYPDSKLEKASKYIKTLDDSETSEMIKYFIQKKDEIIERQRQQLKEYQDIFDKIGKFIPYNNPTVYR